MGIYNKKEKGKFSRMDGQKLLTEVIKRSETTFRSLNSKLHMVLFFDGKLFDFIPATREIRPYNTCNWICVNGEERYDALMDYLNDIYEEIEEKDRVNPGEYDVIIGFKVGSILAIDMDNMIDHLLSISTMCIIHDTDEYENREEILDEINKETKILVYQAHEFMNILSNAYEICSTYSRELKEALDKKIHF